MWGDLIENHGFDSPLYQIVERFNSGLYNTALSHELPLYNMMGVTTLLYYTAANFSKIANIFASSNLNSKIFLNKTYRLFPEYSAVL
jgi:hypothetical protein